MGCLNLVGNEDATLAERKLCTEFEAIGRAPEVKIRKKNTCPCRKSGSVGISWKPTVKHQVAYKVGTGAQEKVLNTGAPGLVSRPLLTLLPI